MPVDEGNHQVNNSGQPLWGKLMMLLREEHVPPLSRREAARRAGFSVSTWSQGEQGYRQIAPGITVPNRMRTEHLAQAVLMLGGTPDQLRDAGRDDAAKFLERLRADRPRPSGQVAARAPDDARESGNALSLAGASNEQLIAELQRRLGAGY